MVAAQSAQTPSGANEIWPSIKNARFSPSLASWRGATSQGAGPNAPASISPEPPTKVTAHPARLRSGSEGKIAEPS
eukprot:7817849-Pyramimonas_sp.AAC.1